MGTDSQVTREETRERQTPPGKNQIMAYLTIVSGPRAGQVLPLMQERVTIRRVSKQDVALADEVILSAPEMNQVSKHHALIVRQGNQFYIRDGDEQQAHSRHGTFLNGQPLTERFVPLRDGDCLALLNPPLLAFRFSLEFPAEGGRQNSQLEGVPPLSIIRHEDEDATPSRRVSFVDILDSSRGGTPMAASLEARFEAVLEIMSSLGKALATDEVLAELLNSLFKIFAQADRGVVILQSPDGSLEPRWRKFRNPTAEEPPISRRVIREVMTSKRALRLEDWVLPEGDSDDGSLGPLRHRSVICAPLLDSQGVALGAVQLDTADSRRPFRQEDLELFATVSLPAGIAVDNAQLHAQAVRRRGLEEDLKLAWGVQQSFLPKRFPELQEYEFFHFYQPMIEVGGDYYDYVEMDDGRLALLVADVVGHGVQAALMVGRLSAEAKFCLARESQPARAVAMLNDRLVALLADPDEGRFVTLVLVVLDPQQHEAAIVIAGHPAPIWRHSDATVEMPGDAQRSGVTGIEPGAVFEQVTIPLAPGDTLAMYTDGVSDARDAQERSFGTAGMLRHLQRQDLPDDLAALGQAIVTDVRDHIGVHEQADDMCLVLLRRKPLQRQTAA